MPRAVKTSLLSLVLTLFSAGSTGARLYTVGDLNADNKVNFKDLQIFSLQWLDPSGCFGSGCADLDGLNGVDLADYALLAAKWQDIRTHLVISEFMASNASNKPPLPPKEGDQLDGNGDSSDWIEIYNPTDAAVSLDGWYLTDSNDDRDKWQFPDGLEIDPGGFRIVFASDKTEQENPSNYPYVDPKGYYHTNFELDKDKGEYLALVLPDGNTATHEYAPEFPVQLTDISYGLAQYATTLVCTGATASYYVPTSDDAILGTDWAGLDFNDS
ncbi:MAG TPA: lamin tail domain-containing protein, partial [Sedimentisphaerales bacterium]|nr:lamin tail domain-containing protein [Sedimentisphaerales bacterium]